MKRRRHYNSRKRLKVKKHKHVKAPKGSRLCGIMAELILNSEQKQTASRLLGCGRLVYNKCLGYNNYWYSQYKEALKKNEENENTVSEQELQRLKENSNIYILPDVFELFKEQPGYAFLKDCNQKVLQ